jgi:hypothetical protein
MLKTLRVLENVSISALTFLLCAPHMLEKILLWFNLFGVATNFEKHFLHLNIYPTEIWSHILHFIILQDKKHNHTCKVYANIYIQQYNKYWHI